MHYGTPLLLASCYFVCSDRLGGGHHHRGVDGQLRGGGDQREDHQGQLTLLKKQRQGVCIRLIKHDDLRAAEAARKPGDLYARSRQARQTTR